MRLEKWKKMVITSILVLDAYCILQMHKESPQKKEMRKDIDRDEQVLKEKSQLDEK